MWGISWPQLFIRIVIIAACVALVWLALTSMGIAIPAWVITAFWIVLIAVGVILAIKFVASMW